MADGWGKKVFSCLDMHEGHYKEDKRCGFGLYSWMNGDRYGGEWKNGRMDGKGVKIMANGDVYNGKPPKEPFPLKKKLPIKIPFP